MDLKLCRLPEEQLVQARTARCRLCDYTPFLIQVVGKV
jgi:hypothetical protein